MREGASDRILKYMRVVPEAVPSPLLLYFPVTDITQPNILETCYMRAVKTEFFFSLTL